MPISVVQSTTAKNSNTVSLSFSTNNFSSNPVVGHTILVCARCYTNENFSNLVFTFSDPFGNPYTKLSPDTSTGYFSFTVVGTPTWFTALAWAPVNTTGGSFAVTVTLSGTGITNGATYSIAAVEISGLGSPTIDGITNDQQDSGFAGDPNPTAGTYTASHSGSLFVTGFHRQATTNNVLVSTPSGYTGFGRLDDASTYPDLGGDTEVKQISGTSDTPIWTLTSSEDWYAWTLALKAGAAPPAPTYYPATIYFIM